MIDATKLGKLAIYGKHFEATKCLLQFGADPNVSDDDQV